MQTDSWSHSPDVLCKKAHLTLCKTYNWTKTIRYRDLKQSISNFCTTRSCAFGSLLLLTISVRIHSLLIHPFTTYIQIWQKQPTHFIPYSIYSSRDSCQHALYPSNKRSKGFHKWQSWNGKKSAQINSCSSLLLSKTLLPLCYLSFH